METSVRAPVLCATLIATLGVAACQPSIRAAGDRGSLLTERVASREPGRVSAEELNATGGTNLRDALRRARPEYLRETPVSNGDVAPPAVYIDGRHAGEPSLLQVVQVAEIAEVRFLRPTAARGLYGWGCPCAGGVIAVTTRRAP